MKTHSSTIHSQLRRTGTRSDEKLDSSKYLEVRHLALANADHSERSFRSVVDEGQDQPIDSRFRYICTYCPSYRMSCAVADQRHRCLIQIARAQREALIACDTWRRAPITRTVVSQCTV